MKLRFVGVGILLLAVLFLIITGCNDTKQMKVGIIIPIEHEAMNDIVSGFRESLTNLHKEPIKFRVANAQGDLNIQRAIIQQMQNEKYDLIVPIGTGPTQMAVSMIRNTPILSLAAIFTAEDRKKLKTCNIAVVHDEIPAEKIINFIATLDPNMQRIVLIHSPADKIFSEAKEIIALGKSRGIEVRPIMVPSLNELYSAVNNIQDAQAILILKDNLIVSGISTVAMSAKKHHIPLITADEGSVRGGASVGLGVREKQIGIEGAEIANQILAGKNACDFEMIDMTKLTVFVNKTSLGETSLSLATIDKVASSLNYATELETARSQ